MADFAGGVAGTESVGGDVEIVVDDEHLGDSVSGSSPAGPLVQFSPVDRLGRLQQAMLSFVVRTLGFFGLLAGSALGDRRFGRRLR